jgi:hypothetical protein
MGTGIADCGPQIDMSSWMIVLLRPWSPVDRRRANSSNRLQKEWKHFSTSCQLAVNPATQNKQGALTHTFPFLEKIQTPWDLQVHIPEGNIGRLVLHLGLSGRISTGIAPVVGRAPTAQKTQMSSEPFLLFAGKRTVRHGLSARGQRLVPCSLCYCAMLLP